MTKPCHFPTTPTLAAFMARFPDEESCLRHLEQLKWPAGFACRRCGASRHGYTRLTRVLVCRCCGKHESILSGTLFEASKLPLRQWFLAAWLLAEDKRGISAARLAHFLGVSYRTAWRMLAKLRLAMGRAAPVADTPRGTFQLPPGCSPKSPRKGSGPPGRLRAAISVRVTTAGRRFGPIVMHMVTGDDVDPATTVLGSDPGNSAATDASASKRPGDKRLSPPPPASPTTRDDADGRKTPRRPDRPTIHASPAPPLRRRLRTTGHAAAESREPTRGAPAWVRRAALLLRRWLLGTHHGVSQVYLQRYLDEFCYRYNRRAARGRRSLAVVGLAVSSAPVRVRALCYQP